MPFSSPNIPLVLPSAYVGNTGNTVVGAIRWDAWHHPTVDTVRGAMETSLGPAQYHARLPFFGTEPSANTVSIAGGQSNMDAEITYAVNAGLDYWAFLWYGLASTMMQAWTYFQASPNKTQINWCIYFAGPSTLVSEVTNSLASLVTYIQQSNYQKVLTNRPLIFCFDDGSSTAGLGAAVTSLRNAVTAAGVANPYVAFHQSNATQSVLTTFGFDASTKYAHPPTVVQPTPFKYLDSSVRNFWRTSGLSGAKIIPIVMIGWDRRPRVEHTVPWEAPGGSLDDYYFLERTSDFGAHLDAALAWVRANPTIADANCAIIYAWNEHDEGGWICPTLIPGSLNINSSRVTELAKVLV